MINLNFELFKVGGCVRDELLGVPTKDIDFSVVAHNATAGDPISFVFSTLEDWLKAQGFKIFLSTPEFLTIRAQFPEHLQSEFNGVRDADFVLARTDGPTADGRRPSWVRVGTLHDDLARRDFTMNAMAQTIDGTIIDPFDGQGDLALGLIRFVGDPMERIREDALRVMRAIRFNVTKGFFLERETSLAIKELESAELLRSISEERRADELDRMFLHDSHRTIRVLASLPTHLLESIFSGRVRLMSTLKS